MLPCNTEVTLSIVTATDPSGNVVVKEDAGTVPKSLKIVKTGEAQIDLHARLSGSEGTL